MNNQSSTKIVICDDHSLFRGGVKASLQSKEGVEIIGEAIHGKDLLDKLAFLKPDMIIMGIAMPVMDGMTALPILRSRYSHIKVIILSMHNDPNVICRMLELGASAYLTKESGAEKIYETILACKDRWLYINDIAQKAINNRKVENKLWPIEFNEKELAIIKLLQANKTTAEIADDVDLSERTVIAVCENLKKKTGTDSVNASIEFCVKNKIIE